LRIETKISPQRHYGHLNSKSEEQTQISNRSKIRTDIGDDDDNDDEAAAFCTTVLSFRTKPQIMLLRPHKK
jgi:hypothetical protein